MRNLFKLAFLSFFVFSFLVITPQPADAQDIKAFLTTAGIKDGQIVPEGCTKDTTIEKCGLKEVYQLIANIALLILVVTGPILILMFIYGGVLWIISAGNQEKIQQGKLAITSAVIGLVIVLGAYLIVNTVIASLTGSSGQDVISDDLQKLENNQ